ncbi:uncharacterized protein LOC114932141 [Nylanderia fulva]|uniref:uncharacterized protein LOC114932141 n=1 Tax=Nylanderia fulva TaxID=613905 RepID=UPI0010FB879B|nr:uncharacterized protein LOC114932141 [Nylanderia fulva]
MSDHLSQQLTMLQSVERALSNFKKVGRANYTAAKIRQRMSTLKETWTRCIEKHAILARAFTAEQQRTMDYFSNTIFENCEEYYETTLDYMADCLEELDPTPTRTSLSQSTISTAKPSSFSLTHLPPIQLPPFSGNVEDWESFRDRFTSLIIQNTELTAFSRMHFLASSLTGRAFDTIKSIQITADNFDIAWKTLISRFDNKQRLVDVHVSALYSLPTVARESAVELNALRAKANRAIASLQNLNRSPDQMLSDMLVFSVTQKLDHATRKAWKLKTGDDPNIPSYEALDRFLDTRIRALKEISPANASKFSRVPKVTSANATASGLSCPLCRAAHFINKCPQFLRRTPSQRLEVILKAKRCVNCLSAKHAVQTCPSQYSCRTCQSKHHSMLHVDSASSSTASVVSLKNETSSSVSSDSIAITSATALCSQRTGSEITFITERLAQTLRMRRIRQPLSISAVGGMNAGTCQFAAKIRIAPINQAAPVLTTTASILRSLTKYSPYKANYSYDWSYINNLNLADPNPTSADPIEILIGADLYGELLLSGVRKGAPGQPIAQQTIFGWVLSGPISELSMQSRAITVQHCANSEALDQELRRFWEIEETPRQALLSPEEQQCEEHFTATHSRSADGRYTVRLPFKRGSPIDIGDSRHTAERFLRGLHRRFLLHSDLRAAYAELMHDYESLGHMNEVKSDQGASQEVYLPHHPVIRDSSVTTRLRVVFNASSLTTNSTSLNNYLLTGPQLQADLSAVILRWRQFRYVYAADITKMYRQIVMDPRDIDYQRILWSGAPSEPARAYQLTTVTYGTACAPFLALRVIRQLAQDEGSSFPLAAIVLQNTYVGDVLFGADDIPLLRQVREQVCALLRRGRFELRKWAQLLSDIASADHGLVCDKMLQTDDHLKILGIRWNPSSDAFQFNVTLPHSEQTTKRSILSTIARLFDPLGWSTPVTVVAKIFLQKLWLLKIGWDDVLSADILDRWDTIRSSLAALHGLQLDRWIQRGADSVRCDLHGFADASLHAYAAAVYIRIVSLSGEITVQLLIGKSKVAPIKTLSIPQLELAAAVLLAKLIDFVRSSLHLPADSCHCWTDSTVVLAWVAQHPSKWKTFVANRVSEIQSRLPNAQWSHVPTDHNTADCASRGIPGENFASHTLWWRGPAWLHCSESEWPVPFDSSPSMTTMERKENAASYLVSRRKPWDLAARYSSWPRLIRVTAYIMRFISKLKRHLVPRDTCDEGSRSISALECRKARDFWLSQIQSKLFAREKESLLQQRSIPAKSALLFLTPFLGEDKLIRVGGRLSRAPMQFSEKHPIILAAHPLVNLLVQHVHLRSLHAGPQLTLATLCQEYWILRARNIVKGVVFRCVVCTREKAATPTQLMGNLPSVRVSPPARAFIHCGLDYAGPVLIKSMLGRGVASRKAYISIFVCMATRAIHLELVESYSTPAFSGAFSRFYSRRGLPESVYSDNGTTFVGADRELAASFRAALRDPNFPK